MTLSARTRTLLAGLTIILAVNAIALAGVAYNRSGTPESVLLLSQRELHEPYVWQQDDENSGIALSLQWRVMAEAPESDDVALLMGYSGSYARDADWLDADKLASLGFSLPAAALESDAYPGFRRPPSRELLLVLEQDGESFRQALDRMRSAAVAAQSKLAAEPDNKDFERRATAAQAALTKEEGESSRLFVVDAGLDADVLRSKYPDRARHAIVGGLIRPQWSGATGNRRWQGVINALSIKAINVPKAFRSTFEERARSSSAREENGRPFEAEVAFGKRLEPWIVTVNGKRN